MLGILIKNPGKKVEKLQKTTRFFGVKGVYSKFKKVSVIQKVGTI